VDLEKSYLIDFSKELIAWVKAEKYSLLDVNLFPKPFAKPLSRSKSPDEIRKLVATYLWDNYVLLSNATSVILIGHGHGCRPVMDLLETRTVGVMRMVKVVIQVTGHSKLPMVPKDADDLRVWYRKHSLVIIPSTHRVLGPDTKAKDLRRHGTLSSIDEPQPVRLIMRALPGIKEFVKTELARAPLSERTPLLNTTTARMSNINIS